MPFEGMTCLDPFDFQPFSLILVGIFMNIVALKVLNYNWHLNLQFLSRIFVSSVQFRINNTNL